MDRIDASPAEPTALSPMRFPVFRAVWFASTLASFGALIQSVGAAWLMISIAQSADMVALVQTSIALPVMLLSLVAGALADNRDRRIVMLGTQVFMLTVSVVLAAFAWAGLITPWLLLLFTFLIGCGSAFNAPAWQASVGDMVPRTELPGAVALNSLGFNIARSVGPAIGGAIVAAAGAAAAFAVNAASYVALIVVLARWHPVRIPGILPRESLGAAMAAGIRYASMSPAIRNVLLRSAIFGAGASGLVALMPLVARHLLGGGPLVYGLMLGAFGVGAVAGAIGAARLRREFATETIVRAACVAFAIAAAIAGLSTNLPTTMAGLLLAGAGWVLTLATFNVAVQLSAPRWVVARALSLYQMAAFGGMAGGSWLWGVVAEREGIMFSLLACATVLLACAAFGAWRPLAQSKDLDLDPLRDHWKEPQTAVPVDPRTGPVVITIEYVIREEDQMRFLVAMSERRRIRRRDGALNWRLLRDLSDAELWIERYETPTWLDYLRLNNRVTRNDAVVPESLRALHRGPDAPRVRRMIERPAAAPSAARAAGPESGSIVPD
ncbi:MAG TPA: MFS transporter [Steroidobacteraceae bacterium]|nr:MFS transporter [Steroidobacteraceae bacterium]